MCTVHGTTHQSVSEICFGVLYKGFFLLLLTYLKWLIHSVCCVTDCLMQCMCVGLICEAQSSDCGEGAHVV